MAHADDPTVNRGVRPSRQAGPRYVLALGLAVIACNRGGHDDPTQGSLRLLLTDKPPDLQITSVSVSIDSIKVHGERSGWHVVSTAPRTFDLVTLKNVTAELALAVLPPDH